MIQASSPPRAGLDRSGIGTGSARRHGRYGRGRPATPARVRTASRPPAAGDNVATCRPSPLVGRRRVEGAIAACLGTVGGRHAYRWEAVWTIPAGTSTGKHRPRRLSSSDPATAPGTASLNDNRDGDRDRMTQPDWVRHAIWWHVYPLGFVGPYGSTRRGRRSPAEPPAPLAGLRRRLGVSGHRCSGRSSPPSTHGYDTSTTSASTHGSAATPTSTGSSAPAARTRLRVLLDGVFNHVGRGHPLRGRLGQGRAERPLRSAPVRWPRGGGDRTDFEGHDAARRARPRRPSRRDTSSTS